MLIGAYPFLASERSHPSTNTMQRARGSYQAASSSTPDEYVDRAWRGRFPASRPYTEGSERGGPVQLQRGATIRASSWTATSLWTLTRVGAPPLMSAVDDHDLMAALLRRGNAAVHPTFKLSRYFQCLLCIKTELGASQSASERVEPTISSSSKLQEIILLMGYARAFAVHRFRSVRGSPASWLETHIWTCVDCLKLLVEFLVHRRKATRSRGLNI
ncbi:hypothetical protein C8R47DRAFT_1072105 [Mycena vitilis]|nr:hypothetical protein C8R47DRAFT_1072105 [Mycena vitilis]